MIYFSEYIFPVLMLVLGSAITILCGTVMARVKSQQTETLATKTAIRLIMIRDMRIDYRRFVVNEEVTSYERQSWHDMYKSAKALGMNGELDAEWEDITDLPLKVINERR
jgi:hypothetical protein